MVMHVRRRYRLVAIVAVLGAYLLGLLTPGFAPVALGCGVGATIIMYAVADVLLPLAARRAVIRPKGEQAPW